MSDVVPRESRNPRAFILIDLRVHIDIRWDGRMLVHPVRFVKYRFVARKCRHKSRTCYVGLFSRIAILQLISNLSGMNVLNVCMCVKSIAG